MRSAVLAAALLTLSCGDASIGTEPCVGPACDSDSRVAPELLLVDFTEVSTLAAEPVEVAWRVPNPCAQPCSARPELFSAGSAGAWNIVREAPIFAVQLISPEGTVQSRYDVTPPLGSATLSRHYQGGTLDGRLMVHLQWAAGERSIDEILTFSPGAAPYAGPITPERTTLLGEPGRRQPPGAIGTPRGFLMFDDFVERGDPPGSFNYVRHIERNGKTVWQQGKFPSYVSIVGKTAAQTSQNFVIGGREGSGAALSYRMLWLTADGTVDRVTQISSASWRDLRLLQSSEDGFVAVSQSDLLAAGTGSGDTDGNIDIVPFRGRMPERGFRLRQDCYFKLTLNGFSFDQQGTYFVSTQGGIRNEPRGLLCRLPATEAPACFATELGKELGALVALGGDAVIAAMGDEIVRIDLAGRP